MTMSPEKREAVAELVDILALLDEQPGERLVNDDGEPRYGELTGDAALAAWAERRRAEQPAPSEPVAYRLEFPSLNDRRHYYVRADAARSIIAGETRAEGVRHRAAAEQHKHSRDALSDSSRRASLAHAFRYEGVARWLRSQKGGEDPIRTPSLGQPAPATNHTEALGPSTTPEEGGGR